MDFVDLLLQIPLFASIPLLVSHYLRADSFSKNMRIWIGIGGILWLLYANLSHDLAYSDIGNFDADDLSHLFTSRDLARQMADDFFLPWGDGIPVGNRLFDLYGATIIFLTGASGGILWVIHGFLGFWAGLTLARILSNLSLPGSKTPWLFFAAIFLPSFVFWSCRNMKEPLLLWGICQMLAGVGAPRRGTRSFMGYVVIVLGWASVGLMRPFIAVCFGLPILLTTFQRKHLYRYGLLMLIVVMPLLYYALDEFTKGEAFDDPLGYGQGYADRVSSEGGRNRASIERGPYGAIPFIAGFESNFFRPFIWEAFVAPRVLGTAIEVWMITLLLVYAWFGMRQSERRRVLKMPPVRVAIMAVFFLMLPMSFLGNEGQVARYRTQVYPATLILAFVPLLQREKMRRYLEVNPHFAGSQNVLRTNRSSL